MQWQETAPSHPPPARCEERKEKTQVPKDPRPSLSSPLTPPVRREAGMTAENETRAAVDPELGETEGRR